jgi:Protein of unknown function (DUF1566)
MPNGPYDVANEGAPNLEMYQLNGDGTVSDQVTHLMWQQAADPLNYTQSDALAYCMNLDLGGHTDWRLPTRIELVSIVDYSVGGDNIVPTINAVAFPNTPVAGFWSSTPLSGTPTFGFYVWFNFGIEDFGDGATAFRVRCVR